MCLSLNDYWNLTLSRLAAQALTSPLVHLRARW
nr:MAG TPA: hypothetical protein [Caudoviricetes sp.]